MKARDQVSSSSHKLMYSAHVASNFANRLMQSVGQSVTVQTSLGADLMGNAWRGDYQDIRQIWKGQHPVTGAPLRVEEGSPVGGPILGLDVLPEEFAPGITAEDYQRIAKRLIENL